MAKAPLDPMITAEKVERLINQALEISAAAHQQSPVFNRITNKLQGAWGLCNQYLRPETAPEGQHVGELDTETL